MGTRRRKVTRRRSDNQFTRTQRYNSRQRRSLFQAPARSVPLLYKNRLILDECLLGGKYFNLTNSCYYVIV
jgi:hypothetical protein